MAPKFKPGTHRGDSPAAAGACDERFVLCARESYYGFEHYHCMLVEWDLSVLLSRGRDKFPSYGQPHHEAASGRHCRNRYWRE